MEKSDRVFEGTPDISKFVKKMPRNAQGSEFEPIWELLRNAGMGSNQVPMLLFDIALRKALKMPEMGELSLQENAEILQAFQDAIEFSKQMFGYLNLDMVIGNLNMQIEETNGKVQEVLDED